MKELPRHRLATLPTPLARARGLERVLGHGPIYLKRDDLTGFGVAGNKARALEYLVGDALARGADVLVTGGSASSNFCAGAAMAAAVSGMACDLLLPGAPPTTPAVNVELARTAGARVVFGAAATRDELDDAVHRHAEALRATGRVPYAVPRGGATAAGAAGYVEAVRELADQCRTLGVDLRTVVVSAGSGATYAGLVAGQVGLGVPWRTVGASVSRPVGQLTPHVLTLARATADLLGLPTVTEDEVELHDQRGPGFGVPSEQDRESAGLALRAEGLLLDHTYGAKALTLLRTLLEDGARTPALFWHTGGVATVLSALTGSTGH